MNDTNTEHAPPRQGADPFRRSTDDRIFAGVAGGVAERLDIPAWVVRLGFILLTIGGGFGIALYLAGWLLVPRADEDEAIARRFLGNADGNPNWIGIGLIAAGVFIAADNIGFIRRDLILAVMLAVVGVLLYRGDIGVTRAQETGPDGADEATSDESPSQDGPTPQVELSDDESTPPPAEPPVAPPPSAAKPPKPPKPPKPRSILGRVTFAATLIALGALAFFDFAMSTFDPAPRHYIGTLLGLTGIGLVVGAWVGRARGLIFLGILTIPWLIAAPLAEFDYSASIGERDVDPTSVEQIAPSYELSIGELVIDLRDVDFAGQTVEFDASVGIGSLEILLPDGVGVDARAQVGLGEAQIFGTARAGGAREIDIMRTGEGLVVIDARTNVGQVVIREGGASSTATAAGDGVGTIYERVVAPSDLQPVYELDGGNLTLDLSQLVVETTRTVTLRNGVGRIRVLVGDQGATEVRATADFGSIRLFDDTEAGLDVEVEHLTERTPTLVLDIAIDGGEIVVEEN